MTKLIDLLDQLKHRRTFGFFDDFDYYASGGRWTSVLGGAGAMSVGDNPQGILTITPSGGSPALNDECYVRNTNAVFQFATDQSLVFEALVQFSEANTNKANVLVGLMDSVAAGALVNGSGGPKSSSSALVFYKKGSTNVWACETVGGGTHSLTTTAPAGGANYQTLTGQWQPISATQAEGRFFIDGLLVAKQLFTYSGAVPMQLCAGVKNGSASMETLNVDYLAGYQLR
jgi:hypothetical protein